LGNCGEVLSEQARRSQSRLRNLARGLALVGFLALNAILVRNTLIDVTGGSYSADPLFVETNVAVVLSVCALGLLYFEPVDLGRWKVSLWVLLMLPALAVACIKLQTLGVL
jgi:hypothetical protein